MVNPCNLTCTVQCHPPAWQGRRVSQTKAEAAAEFKRISCNCCVVRQSHHHHHHQRQEQAQATQEQVQAQEATTTTAAATNRSVSGGHSCGCCSAHASVTLAVFASCRAWRQRPALLAHRLATPAGASRRGRSYHCRSPCPRVTRCRRTPALSSPSLSLALLLLVVTLTYHCPPAPSSPGPAFSTS